MELSHTAMAGLQTAVPLPVAFPARNATAASIKAAPPGVELASFYDGTDGGFGGRSAWKCRTATWMTWHSRSGRLSP